MENANQHPGGNEPGAAGRLGGGPSAWAAVVLVVAVCLVVLLPRIATLALADLDESRCALIVRRMVRDGEWLVPHLDGELYFSKPPLFFWAAAVLERLGVSGPAAGRLVSVLAAVAVSLLTYDIGRRWWNRRTGTLAALLSLLTPSFVVTGRFYRMDMLLVACVTFSLWCFCRLQLAGAGASRARLRMWWLLFCAGAAVGTLTKGPVALVLPGIILFVHLLLRKDWKGLLRLFDPAGIAVYLALAAPWFVFMSLKFPDYFRSFFITENVERFATSALGHLAATWFYVPVVLAGFLPWSCLLPLAIADSFPRRRGDPRSTPETSLLWIWTLTVVVFFTVARSKLPQYVLPAWPALGLLTARALVKRWRLPARGSLTIRYGALAIALILVGFTACLVVAQSILGVTPSGSAWLFVTAGAAAAAVVAAVLRSSTGRLCLVLCGSVAVYAFLVVILVTPGMFVASSDREAALAVRPHLRPDDLLWQESGHYSFPYYAGRYRASKVKPEQAVLEIGRLTREGVRLWYFLPTDDYQRQLKGHLPVPLHVVTHVRDWVVVTNRPLPGKPED